MNELRTVARGWRWGRRTLLPREADAPRARTESAFETAWSRRDGWNTVRAVVQETALLPLVRAVARPAVRGRERLRRVPQPAIIAANHASHVDTVLLIDALPPGWRHKLVVGAAADYFFTGSIRGNAAALAIGAFPIDRSKASASSAKLALRLVQEGWNLVLYPEGGRTDDGWLQELTPGAAFVAAHAGRPLVPVWITGTEFVWRKGQSRPRFGRTDVLIGDALIPEPGERRRDLNARLELAMRRLQREASSDWWTAMRADDTRDAHGPDAPRWRRIWARGDAPKRARSNWR